MTDTMGVKHRTFSTLRKEYKSSKQLKNTYMICLVLFNVCEIRTLSQSQCVVYHSSIFNELNQNISNFCQ